jgi:hypothetical protein
MLWGIAGIAFFADASDSHDLQLSFGIATKTLCWPSLSMPAVLDSIVWYCQHLRLSQTMGLLQSWAAVVILFQSCASAHGSLGYAQEKPLVGDASFDYAEACPDYAKYSTSPQYV